MSQNGYEKRDVNVMKVMLVAIGPALFIVLSLIGLDQFFTISSQKLYYQKVLKPEATDYVELRNQEAKQLENYDVLDTTKGIYQIPIERAKQLLVNEAIARRH
ncbi:MAG: hypothetical protein R3A11_06980 [Bdellovibrionota bacterium]